jgi:hypothetical protein
MVCLVVWCLFLSFGVVLGSERASPFAWFGLWLRRVNALIALFSVFVVAVM